MHIKVQRYLKKVKFGFLVVGLKERQQLVQEQMDNYEFGYLQDSDAIQSVNAAMFEK